jgi:hypothetical protein
MRINTNVLTTEDTHLAEINGVLISNSVMKIISAQNLIAIMIMLRNQIKKQVMKL